MIFKTMKILFIAPKIPYPPTDGGKISIWGVLKTLSDFGNQIDFVAYSHSRDYDLEVVRQYCHPTILNENTQNSVFGAFLNLFSKTPYNVSKYHKKSLVKYIRAYFKGNRSVDIVHITNLHMGWVIDEIKKYVNIPVVLRQENLEMYIMKRFYENEKNFFIKSFAWLQYVKFKSYEPKLCKKFDQVIMISPDDKKRLKELDPEIKVEYIPAGVDRKIFNSYKKDEKEKHSMFHIGHLDWFPNLDSIKYFIYEILPVVKSSLPSIKFYIYGGKIPPHLSIPNSVQSCIIEKGFVDNLWEDLADKELAIVPLRIGSGMRLKIVELLAAGHVVLTTSIGTEGIPTKHNENLLIADGTKSFAHEIINYFNNVYDRDKLVNNARKFVLENYSWDSIGKKFVNIYKELISNYRQ